MDTYIGKICPYCRTPINSGDTVKVCPACGIPHHEGCWNENHGCTTFGCSQQHYVPQNAGSSIVCPNCLTPLSEAHAFCPTCGTAKPAAPAPAPAPQKDNVCTGCGTELAEGQAFCPRCGTPRPVVKKPVCTGCGAELTEGQAFCSRCGTPVVPEKKQNLCSKCGAELTEGQAFCDKCGQKAGLAIDADVNAAINQFNANVVEQTKKKSGAGKILLISTVAVLLIVAMIFLVNKASGPDLKSMYNQYCSSTWAECGSDGSYLSIDTNPYNRDDSGLAYPAAYTAIKNVNKALGLPSSLTNDMGETTGADGRQNESFPDVGVTVSWRYHPDKGLEVTYKLMK